MLDFHGILTAQAYRRSMQQTVNDADAEMDKANAIIERKNQTIREMTARIEELERTLLIERAHSAGLGAQGKAARAALQNGGGTALLGKTGRKYESGPQDALHVIYEKAFDARGKELGLAEPHKARAQAR